MQVVRFLRIGELELLLFVNNYFSRIRITRLTFHAPGFSGRSFNHSIVRPYWFPVISEFYLFILMLHPEQLNNEDSSNNNASMQPPPLEYARFFHALGFAGRSFHHSIARPHWFPVISEFYPFKLMLHPEQLNNEDSSNNNASMQPPQFMLDFSMPLDLPEEASIIVSQGRIDFPSFPNFTRSNWCSPPSN